MAAVSPAATSSLAHLTPSPFSISVASTRLSSRPPLHLLSIVLRFLAVVFTFVSALSLATHLQNSFTDHTEFMYSFIVSILTFTYSSFQLFKGICDIAYRGIVLSDMISDYSSFIMDQLVCYLLISSSSVTIPAIQQLKRPGSVWKAAIVSTTMSFVTFICFAISTILSGYRLCKRIIW